MHKREKRQKCYDARDSYFSCIENKFGKDLGPPIPETDVQPPSVDRTRYDVKDKICFSEHAGFVKECPDTWYEHFIKKLHLNIRNRQLGLEINK